MKDGTDTTGKVMDHSYDGIQEFDNPTPGWWSAVFFVSILFAVAYGFYYHVTPEPGSVKESYEDAVTANLQKQWGKMGTLSQEQDALLGYMQNKDFMRLGGSVFKANCVSCHGADGAGLIGPNMTDDFYKNIKVLGDIPKVINGGAAGGQMPSWQNRLHHNEVALVAAYVASLRGQNLPGRAPEGARIDPWPAAPASAPASLPAGTAPGVK